MMLLLQLHLSIILAFSKRFLPIPRIFFLACRSHSVAAAAYAIVMVHAQTDLRHRTAESCSSEKRVAQQQAV